MLGKKIYVFFWWLAGANIKILKEHIVDHNKYFQMGVAVFITTIMATLTGGFAIHYTVNKGFEGDVKFITIIGALFWGFIILNIDRFLLISIYKRGNSLIQATTYEKFYNFLKEFFYALPRIILAVLIANIILVPLELYIFKNQIENQIPIIIEQEQRKFINLKQEEEKKLIENFNKRKMMILEKYNNLLKPFLNEKKSLENLIKQLQASPQSPKYLKLLETKKEIEKQINFYRKLRDEELKTGKGEGFKFANEHLSQARKELNQINHEIKKEIERLKEISSKNIKELKKLKEKLEKINNQISIYEEEKSKKIEEIFQEVSKKLKIIEEQQYNYKQKYKKGDIILALKAKDVLFSSDKKYEYIHNFLAFLLIVIELLPLIVKLLLPRTSYDAHIQRLSEEEALKQDAIIRDKKLKYFMDFKILKMEENMKYESLENKLKKIKFSINE